MKQPKKLTRNQKEILSKHYMNANEWSLIQETDFYLTVVHRETGRTKRLDKHYKQFRG